MSLPMQVQSRLYHFKSHILGLVAAHVFSVVMVSRLFGISRTTFAQFIGVCRRSKWSKHVTNSPFLARLAMVGSNAARKMNSACSNALC
jgi:uncharacterized membrane protein